MRKPPRSGRGKGGTVGFWEVLVIALVPTLGVALTVWGSTREFAVRRRLESTDKFFQIIMVAHARAIGREHVGVAEQIASIHLLADFGRSERHLRNAARAALAEIGNYTNGSLEPHVQRVNAAVEEALARLK